MNNNSEYKMIMNGKEMTETITVKFTPQPDEKDYIICYIDLLGTKELVKGNIYHTVFNLLYVTSSFVIDVESKMKFFGQLKFKIFSDNILIANEITDEKDWYSAYQEIISFLKNYLSNFICSGILFRGGITIGKLLINDIIVWGEGLVDAVELEEKVAVYPRIVISNKLLSQMQKIKLPESTSFDEYYYCLQDFDGSFFLDYIQYNIMSKAEYDLKRSHEIMCEKEKAETRQGILQKIRWYLNYLNRAKDIFNEYYGDSNRLEWGKNEKNEG